MIEPAQAQEVRVVKEFESSGLVQSIKPGWITVLTDAGERLELKVQNDSEEALMIAGRPVRAPATIRVSGNLPASLLEKGMVVQFEGRLNEYGKSDGTVAVFQEAPSDKSLQLDFLKRPEKGDFARVAVLGRVLNVPGQTVLVQVPKARWAKQERVSFRFDEQSELRISAQNLNGVTSGDKIRRVLIAELSSGDLVVRSIDIELTAPRNRYTRSYDDLLEQQFRHLANEPMESPRRLTSDFFVLYTDLSDRQAQILMAKLDTMYRLIAGYFGKRPQTPIECYVVDDLNRWQSHLLPPPAVAKILEGAGVTISVTHPTTRVTHSVVYSSAKRGVCQHEAVHAFCAMAFGSTGPVWYSEGMAEMGQYWKPDEIAVNIDPVVIEYLRNVKPKSMMDIVNADQITGDSWQAYAWRWALCHLLATNRNYSRRFKTLGLNLMMGQDDSFDKAFGRVADQISFEYDQFIQNFGNGYRVDLCAWNWNAKAVSLIGRQRTQVDVKAAAGWQPTKVKVIEGVSYDIVAQGKWQTSPNASATDADGDASGRGRLVGMVFQDFEIHGPFELGVKQSFVSPSDGHLFLRCQDNWTELADNSGEIAVHIRQTINPSSED